MKSICSVGTWSHFMHRFLTHGSYDVVDFTPTRKDWNARWNGPEHIVVNSGRLLSRFVSCVGFLLMDVRYLSKHIIGDAFAPTQTNFECVLWWARALRKYIRGVCLLVSFCDSISLAWISWCHRHMSTEVSHWLERIRKACRQVLGAYDVHSGCWHSVAYCALTSYAWIAIETRNEEKFRTDSDGFEMHAGMSLGAYKVHSSCLALSFISCGGFLCIDV